MATEPAAATTTPAGVLRAWGGVLRAYHSRLVRVSRGGARSSRSDSDDDDQTQAWEELEEFGRDEGYPLFLESLRDFRSDREPARRQLQRPRRLLSEVDEFFLVAAAAYSPRACTGAGGDGARTLLQAVADDEHYQLLDDLAAAYRAFAWSVDPFPSQPLLCAYLCQRSLFLYRPVQLAQWRAVLQHPFPEITTVVDWRHWPDEASDDDDDDDFDADDRRPLTAWHFAVGMASPELARLLLRRGLCRGPEWDGCRLNTVFCWLNPTQRDARTETEHVTRVTSFTLELLDERLPGEGYSLGTTEVGAWLVNTIEAWPIPLQTWTWTEVYHLFYQALRRFPRPLDCACGLVHPLVWRLLWGVSLHGGLCRGNEKWTEASSLPWSWRLLLLAGVRFPPGWRPHPVLRQVLAGAACAEFNSRADHRPAYRQLYEQDARERAGALPRALGAALADQGALWVLLPIVTAYAQHGDGCHVCATVADCCWPEPSAPRSPGPRPASCAGCGATRSWASLPVYGCLALPGGGGAHAAAAVAAPAPKRQRTSSAPGGTAP